MPDMDMLSRVHRLPSPEIKIVMRRGRRVTTPELVCIWKECETIPVRFAIIVSTKVDKRATIRNRIKRVLGESVRQLAPNMKIGADVVLIARSNSLGESTEVSVGILKDLFRKSGLLNKSN